MCSIICFIIISDENSFNIFIEKNKIQNFLLEIVTIVIYWSFVTMSLLSFVINSMRVYF